MELLEGDADYVSVGENKKLPQAYRVNAGLLFFQSRHFMTSSQAISLENSAKLYGTTPQAVVVSISEDNAFYDGEMILGNEYSPKCYKNLVIEKTDINFTCPVEESEDNKTEKDDEIEDNKQILLGKYVNIGGYYSYKFISSVYPYETLGADNNLRVYDSSFKINGSKEIFYEDTTVTEVANPDGEGTKTETKVTRKSINFFDTSNISHFSFVTKLSLEDLFRRQLGHNGVSKTGVNELEDIGQQEVLLIENLKINNIYSGKYLSPDNFTQLQLDIDYYADLEVDTYDEFEFLLDIYMNKDSSSDNIYNTTLHRKDLFDVFMFKSNMFETDYSYIMSKHLVLDTDDESGYRYKRDKGTGDVIYTTRAVDALSSPDQQVETILDQLYFGTRTINGIKILYAFKKESLTATEDKNGVIIYHLPDGFDAIDQDNQAVVDRLLPIEIMLLYRLTQIRGVGYVEVNYNINDVNGVSKVENDFVLSKLMVTIYYSNVNRIDTYVLDTYNMGMLMENISTFYLVKSQQQASEGI